MNDRGPAPMHRGGGRNGGRIMFIVAVLMAVIIASLFAVILSSHRGAVPGMLVVVLLVALTACIVIAAKIVERKRTGPRGRASLDPLIERYGLVPYADSKREYAKAWSVLPEIPKNGKIKRMYVGELDGRELTLFEHQFTTMAGQTPIQVSHTVYSVPAPGWPELGVTPRHWLAKLFWRPGGRRPRGSIQTGDHAFDRDWAVRTEHEELVTLLLDDGLRAHIASKPGVRWRIVGERLCLIYTGRLRNDLAEASIDRLRQFLALTPAAFLRRMEEMTSHA